MVVFVCLVWFRKGVRNVRTKNQKEPRTTVVIVAVVKRGEEAQMNE